MHTERTSKDPEPTGPCLRPGNKPGKRIISHRVALVLVILILTPMVIWPAMDTFRPVTHVKVARVLPAVSTVSQTPDQSATGPVPVAPTRTVQAPGWIEPDPYYTAVSALADGVVESIHVLEGEAVTSGQVLARLVSEDAELSLRQARARVATMEAALIKATAEHTAAKTDWDEPVQRERDVAATTAALAEAQAELDQLPSEVRAMEAELERWQQEHERVEDAFKNGAATTRERLVAAYESTSREAGLESLKLKSAVLQARVERLTAEAQAAKRAFELRVTERLALDRAVAGVSDAEAMLELALAFRDEAELRLDRMTLRAPMDGNVLRRFKAPGDKVMVGMDDPYSSQIIHLYDPGRLQVRVDVPLADASQIRVGQRCEVVVDVLPDEVFAGEVTRITHEADLQKNTLQVKVRVLEPLSILKPEMLTRVRFIGGGLGTPTQQDPSNPASTDSPAVQTDRVLSTKRVRVPEACLDGQRVWVVRERRGLRGRVSAVMVLELDRVAGLVTVEGALSVGDLVVEQPQDLGPDERVEVSASQGGVV